jgi:hypothetical protein
LPHRPDLRTQLWMGGTESVMGETIEPDHLAGAMVIDCAGDFPLEYRGIARAYYPRVFMDAEVVPFTYDRLATFVADLATLLSGSHRDGDSALDGAQPERVYILCQQGLNRSGLVSGLLLRALGEDAEISVDLIRRMRPGSLNNQTFTRLIHEWGSTAG